MVQRYGRSVEERFWEKVDCSAPDGCWPWTKSTNAKGYGRFKLDGRSQQSHRVAWFLEHGEWPEQALHTCDNPPCCRPDHLFDGSNTDNMLDMRAKGRAWYQASHCAEGHELPPLESTSRRCLVCKSQKAAERYRLRQALEPSG